MPDIDLHVHVSREYLGLPPLDLNDGISYQVSGNQFLGGQVSYRLNEVQGPYTDGATLVDATRDMVSESLGVEVYGGSQLEREQLELAVIAAFSQFSYTLTVDADGMRKVYTGLPSGYQQTISGPRWAALQGLVVIQFRRQPAVLTSASP